LLASTGEDRTIRLWDPTTGDQLAVLTGHQNRIDGLAFHPDGKVLVSGSQDTTVRQWSIRERRLIEQGDSP
jgi:WD40 repeat protein